MLFSLVSAHNDNSLRLAERPTDALFGRVYKELHRLAEKYLAAERRDHTLQPTALVNEAYLRLSRVDPERWTDRRVFVATAATAMRRILVDHARRRNANKRAAKTVLLDEGALAAGGPNVVDLIALDRALEGLVKTQEQHARIVELHLFGGLSVEETAEVIGVSRRTVFRQLRSARAWLQSELSDAAVGSERESS